MSIDRPIEFGAEFDGDFGAAVDSDLGVKTPALDEVIARTWGFDRLLPLQREAMEAILGGRDSLVVLPTGGGKSLCFQAPALLGEGLAVVVSPLIALMKDQVDALRANGVAAAAFNSTLTGDERFELRQGLLSGQVRLLYVSPERLVGAGGGSFRDLLRRSNVRYVAIDEAHCISQWGHDFRQEYRQLGSLKGDLPGISLHAFTATATETVRRDIVEQLGLERPQVLVGSFDRPNLIYRVERRSGVFRQVRRVIARHPNEGGIVYCLSRREVESLAERLRADGVEALAYHAGLDDAERTRHQEAFVDERVDVIVATVAFGMGIDRSNVRYVVHAGAPRSIEHYQQEAGRAGRDGLEAECVLIYSPADFLKWRRLLEMNGPLTEVDQAHLREMEAFAGRPRCRHASLVEYFGQRFERALPADPMPADAAPPEEGREAPITGCGACDWCLGELVPVHGATVIAQKILSCVARVGQRFGAGQVVEILRGRSSEKVRSRGHHQLSTFGLLSEVPITELRSYIDQLVDLGYLQLEGDRYPILRLGESAAEILRGETSCKLFLPPKPPAADRGRSSGAGGRRGRRSAAGGRAAEDWSGVDRGLFDQLRELRSRLARERNVPPYVIFHDRTLRDFARHRPTNRAQLLTVRGVGEKKAEDLGGEVLATIAAYSTESDS